MQLNIYGLGMHLLQPHLFYSYKALTIGTLHCNPTAGLHTACIWKHCSELHYKNQRKFHSGLIQVKDKQDLWSKSDLVQGLHNLWETKLITEFCIEILICTLKAPFRVKRIQLANSAQSISRTLQNLMQNSTVFSYILQDAACDIQAQGK